MADPKPELSPTMRALGQAIANHPNPVQAAQLGFDLWLEVLGSGHVSTCNFKAGGQILEGEPGENEIVVPVMVIGGRIVIGFDPTLPPDGYALKP